MRKFSFIALLFFGIVAQQVFAQEVILPPVFEGTALEEKAIKVFPSEDKTSMFIAIRVQASEGVSVFTFFDESTWKRTVDVSPFIPDANPDAKKQFASVFCAMNAQNFELACSNGQELLVVDNSKPWFIPVATVPADKIDTVVAELTRRTSAVVAHTAEAPPTPPSGQGPEIVVPAMSPPPEQTRTPVVPYKVVDNTPQRQIMVWDDTPPPPPLPIPRVAADRR